MNPHLSPSCPHAEDFLRNRFSMLTTSLATRPLNQERIVEIFRTSVTQTDVLMELYRLVYPDIDKVKRVEESPAVNRATWGFIYNLYRDFDGRRHPGVMAGGLWLNSGFSVDAELPDWHVRPGGVVMAA